jgi:hypothetical protein
LADYEHRKCKRQENEGRRVSFVVAKGGVFMRKQLVLARKGLRVDGGLGKGKKHIRRENLFVRDG